MEGSHSKVILCVLPTQSGKTFTAISQIDKKIKEDNQLGRSIHIVYTMNTLLNNMQFAKRLEEIEFIYGKGSICVMSSEKNHKYTHVNDIFVLKGLCIDIDTCPRVIVMCSNKSKFNTGLDFIKTINKIENKLHILRVFIYYDELHHYISTPNLRLQIEQLNNFDIVVNITALTATPNDIWQEYGFWSKLFLIQLDNYNDYDYVGYNDMNFVCIDEPNKVFIEYVDDVLRKHQGILKNNTRTFIPAERTCTSHNYIRDIVFNINKNCVVVVINGTNKTLQYNNANRKQNIELISKNNNVEEVSQAISRLIIEYKLQNRPIVITGFICISMGQTLTSKSLGSFTSAIFGQSSLSNEQTYQLFGRITGRMKEWGDKYIQTSVYCSTNIMNICKSMETIAVDLALCHNGNLVSKHDYIDPLHQMGTVGQSALENIRIPKKTKLVKSIHVDDDKCYFDFDSQEEAIQFAKKTLDVTLNKRKTNNAPKGTLINGKNPSSEDLFKRMGGLNNTTLARMYPTNNDKWCVYWRPSKIKK